MEVKDEQELLVNTVRSVIERIRFEAESGTMQRILLEPPHHTLEYMEGEDQEMEPSFRCRPGSVHTANNQCGKLQFSFQNLLMDVNSLMIMERIAGTDHIT